MNEILKGMEVFEKAYEELKRMENPQMFFAVIGLLVDQYSADKNLTADKAHSYLQALTEAHEEVNALFGGMTESR